MNKILQLFSEDYVVDLFKEKLLPLYPEYKDIVSVRIKPYKKMVWTTTYHVVIGFSVNFIDANDVKKNVLVVCSAHSSEERKNVFDAMKYLWHHGFNKGQFDVPKPLFYLEDFNGTFYEGVIGENLMYYIKNKDLGEIERIVPLAAQLFAKLHALPVTSSSNFNPQNARIKTVVPGSDMIIREMSYRFEGRFKDSFTKLYSKLIEKEEQFFSRPGFEFCLIHGDAHTENIINTGSNSIGLIDFTDFCLSDFARDVGTFMQQLEYKIMARYNNDIDYAKKMSDLFLNTYLESRDMLLDDGLQERIRLYYDWTAVRTAVYLFLKHDSDPQRAEILLSKVKKDLDID